MDSLPQLSVIVVVGLCRKRAQRVIDSLCAQTVVDSIEIIIFDLAPSDIPKLNTSPDMRVVYLSRPQKTRWSKARAEGVQYASSPIVAFIEDHCFPEPSWAELLIEAHKGPWVAVSYGFKNANPKTYMGRASMVNDYGLWLHPARRGQSDFIPCQNVSYKRDLLLSFGEELEVLLTPDFSLQQVLSQRGLPMFVESRALVAHENFTRLFPLMLAHYSFSRMLAARRVEVQSWRKLRRIFYALAVLPGAPILALVRLFLSLRGRASLWPLVIASLPVCMLAHLWGAIGESMGYFFGPGNAASDLHRWELDTERDIIK